MHGHEIFSPLFPGGSLVLKYGGFRRFSGKKKREEYYGFREKVNMSVPTLPAFTLVAWHTWSPWRMVGLIIPYRDKRTGKIFKKEDHPHWHKDPREEMVKRSPGLAKMFPDSYNPSQFGVRDGSFADAKKFETRSGRLHVFGSGGGGEVDTEDGEGRGDRGE
jgi:hypothetical protein